MPQLIVSTVGTSLLINGQPEDIRQRLNALTNKKAADLAANNNLQYIDTQAAARQDGLLRASLAEARKMSAEINGLAAIYQNQLPQGGGHHHIFLQTDTYQGEKAVDILMAWARGQNMSCDRKTIGGLNTDSLGSFKAALSELARWCFDETASWGRQYKIIFNLTGGFKGVQGFMQTLGMLCADEVVVFFDGAKELLRIPRLPLDIEAAVKNTMRDNISLFRRLALNMEAPEADCRDLPETLLESYSSGRYVLSLWGDMLWQKYRAEIYREKFIKDSPWPEKIIFQPSFLEDAQRVLANQAQHTAQLNERIDDLMGYLYTNHDKNPTRLNFKILQGRPRPDCTHEFYAWSDDSAYRCYCVLQDGVCTVKHLAEHL